MEPPGGSGRSGATQRLGSGPLGAAALGQVLEGSPDGVAVLDEALRVVAINPAGCEIVGRRSGELLGRTGLLAVSPERRDAAREDFCQALRDGRGRRSTTIVRPDGRARDIEYSFVVLEEDGRRMVASIFRDVTEARRSQRWAVALARIASEAALAGSPEAFLTTLARSVVEATDLEGCAAVLFDGEPPRFRVAGTWGLPADYAQRFEEALAAGLDLPALRALRTRQPLVIDRAHQDPVIARCTGRGGDLRRGSVVCVPMVARGQALGALKTFTATADRGPALLRVLGAIADQAAMAVENARLAVDAQARSAAEERNRLARELHDSVSQALFSMTLQTRAAQLALERDGLDASAALGDRLARLRELTEGAHAEMRALIFELRPEAIAEEGLVGAIRKHAGGITARDELPVEVEAAADLIELPADVEEEMYRLVQEALGNVARHARASRARVRLHATATEPRQLIVEIEDDGIGFDPELPRPGHLGLGTMAQRAARLGGTLGVSSAPSRGTVIRATVPVDEPGGADQGHPTGSRSAR